MFYLALSKLHMLRVQLRCWLVFSSLRSCRVGACLAQTHQDSYIQHLATAQLMGVCSERCVYIGLGFRIHSVLCALCLYRARV